MTPHTRVRTYPTHTLRAHTLHTHSAQTLRTRFLFFPPFRGLILNLPYYLCLYLSTCLSRSIFRSLFSLSSSLTHPFSLPFFPLVTLHPSSLPAFFFCFSIYPCPLISLKLHSCRSPFRSFYPRSYRLLHRAIFSRDHGFLTILLFQIVTLGTSLPVASRLTCQEFVGSFGNVGRATRKKSIECQFERRF